MTPTRPMSGGSISEATARPRGSTTGRRSRSARISGASSTCSCRGRASTPRSRVTSRSMGTISGPGVVNGIFPFNPHYGSGVAMSMVAIAEPLGTPIWPSLEPKLKAGQHLPEVSERVAGFAFRPLRQPQRCALSPRLAGAAGRDAGGRAGLLRARRALGERRRVARPARRQARRDPPVGDGRRAALRRRREHAEPAGTARVFRRHEAARVRRNPADQALRDGARHRGHRHAHARSRQRADAAVGAGFQCELGLAPGRRGAADERRAAHRFRRRVWRARRAGQSPRAGAAGQALPAFLHRPAALRRARASCCSGSSRLATASAATARAWC